MPVYLVHFLNKWILIFCSMFFTSFSEYWYFVVYFELGQHWQLQSLKKKQSILWNINEVRDGFIKGPRMNPNSFDSKPSPSFNTSPPCFQNRGRQSGSLFRLTILVLFIWLFSWCKIYDVCKIWTNFIFLIYNLKFYTVFKSNSIEFVFIADPSWWIDSAFVLFFSFLPIYSSFHICKWPYFFHFYNQFDILSKKKRYSICFILIVVLTFKFYFITNIVLHFQSKY